MRLKSTAFLFILLITAVILTGCSGGAATAGSSWPGLNADQENAYLAFNQFVYAINLSNGLEKWRFPVEGNNNITFYATPELTLDGQLVVGDYSNKLHSLNPATGTENWVFANATDRYIAAPLAFNEQIFAANNGHQLYALDMRGNPLWEFETQGPLWAAPTTDERCDCIYVPSMDHHMYAVIAETGELKWQSESFGGSIVSSPTLDKDGKLFFGTFASEVLALDSQTGNVIWRTPTTEWVWGGPVLYQDQLFVGDLGGTLYALDAGTGTIRWQKELDGTITASPLVTKKAIYVPTENGNFYALDFNGNNLWSRQFNTKLHTTPVQAGDLILLAANGGDELLYALESNGNQKWVFIPEKK
jgi:outer membrane protein assembly factor BamB